MKFVDFYLSAMAGVLGGLVVLIFDLSVRVTKGSIDSFGMFFCLSALVVGVLLITLLGIILLEMKVLEK